MKGKKSENIAVQLNELRQELDEIDIKISALLIRRINISESIGKIKKELSLSSYTPEREKDIIKRVTSVADTTELKNHIRNIFQRIIDESRSVQRKIK